ncbi:MAG: hypothetical protein KAT12_00990, partial [Gammaproteobacteria bacterium]|nr:hypothetical protein [Gammaproteobacteria bacterium]
MIDDGVCMMLDTIDTVLLFAVLPAPVKSNAAEAVLSISVPGGVTASATKDADNNTINKNVR